MGIFWDLATFVVAVIVVLGAFSLIIKGLPLPLENIAAENFCQAWAKDQGVTFFKAEYTPAHFVGPTFKNIEVSCYYSLTTFEGAVPSEFLKEKSFLFLHETLLKWVGGGLHE